MCWRCSLASKGHIALGMPGHFLEEHTVMSCARRISLSTQLKVLQCWPQKTLLEAVAKVTTEIVGITMTTAEKI